MDPIKVVILCGGKGTRSYPYTSYFPKVMMPINGTPVIVHLMRIYALQGYTKFVLAAGYRKEILFDYFNGRYQGWDVEVVDTGAESDTGERIRRCRDHVGDTFFATYGDGLGNLNLDHLLAQHRKGGGLATLTVVPLRSQYGLVVFDQEGQVNRFEEKPLIQDYWINAGFFVFQKEAYDHWEGTNLENHVLPGLSAKNRLYTYKHVGFWKSMDTSKDQQELEQIYEVGDVPWMRHFGQAVKTAGEA